MVDKIRQMKVHPRFLISNSTSHPWAFSAIAELIDNSSDAKASEVQIDKLILAGYTCLSFLDDGSGMDKDQLYNMLSLGFCNKPLRTAIGEYGNGSKSGSMRLGKDAIVFTRTEKSAGIGLLSQTYHTKIGADSVLLPMLHYSLPDLEPEEEDDEAYEENLKVILDYSPFDDEESLKEQLLSLPKTGSQIIIYNLQTHGNNYNLELDFDTDPEDIRCPEICDEDLQSGSKYRISLKEYCSILYLHPRMKIVLRQKTVKTRLIAQSLWLRKIDEYTPKRHKSVRITFGFLPDSITSGDCGMMLYVENRLIQPFEQVSCQKKGDGVGARVIGVTQAKFLKPGQNKQGFVRDNKYISAMKAYNTKLKCYWERHNDAAIYSSHSERPPAKRKSKAAPNKQNHRNMAKLKRFASSPVTHSDSEADDIENISAVLAVSSSNTDPSAIDLDADSLTSEALPSTSAAGMASTSRSSRTYSISDANTARNSKKNRKISKKKCGSSTKARSDESAGPSTGARSDESAGPSTRARSDESAGHSTGARSDESAGPSTRARSDESARPSTRARSDESAGPSTRARSDESAGHSTGARSDESAGPSTRARSDESARPSTKARSDESAGPSTRARSDESAGPSTRAKPLVRSSNDQQRIWDRNDDGNYDQDSGSIINGLETESGHLETGSNLVQENAEMETLLENKDKDIANLKRRINTLLTNCRRLLKKLAPDVLIEDDIDIENLIEEMVQEDIN